MSFEFPDTGLGLFPFHLTEGHRKSVFWSMGGGPVEHKENSVHLILEFSLK